MMYREKLMSGACVDKFDVMQMFFASESAEKKAVSEEVGDEKIRLPVSGTLPCHGTFRKFWESMGSQRNARSS
jgi:hypothetical protein